MLKRFAELSEKYRKANFYKVDVDEHSQISELAGARIYPTIIVYRRGAQVSSSSLSLSNSLSRSTSCPITPSLSSITPTARSDRN